MAGVWNSALKTGWIKTVIHTIHAAQEVAEPRHRRTVAALGLIWQQALERRQNQLPWEAMALVADGVQNFLATGERPELDDPEELRDALDSLKAYTEFQPDRFDRRLINSRL